MKKLILPLLFVAFYSFGQKQLTIEDFTTRPVFIQKSVTGINWMKEGKFYTSQDGNKIVKYDIATGQPVETIVDGATLTPALEIDDYSLSGDEKKILIETGHESIYRRSSKAEFYIYDIPTKTLKRLSPNGKQSYATFSPDGSKVAFARNNNLFFVDLATGIEEPVTADGKFNHIINGSTDWVYEEELSFAQAFYWSPDGKKLAYYRFDESNVKEYNMQKWNKGALYPEDYTYKYPKAGEDNSLVEIWIYDVATKQKVKADIGSEKDIYIPRVMWTQNPNMLSIRRMNRLQNTLEILHADAATGKSSLIFTEKRDTYYDIDYTDDLIYLNDGKQFILTSERSGYKHAYLYTITGSLVKQITNGEWEAVQVVGFDEKTKTLYYISTEGNYLDRYFYSISLDGKKKMKLTPSSGTHAINMSADYQFYIDYHHNSTQPLVVSLFQTKGNKLVKVLESNDALKKTISEYALPTKESFKYPSADGSTQLDGYMLKPINFDASKKYPVLVYQYSGPRAPSVRNGWGERGWHYLLVQKGIIVVVIDTRGTGYRGEKFTKQTYKQLGKFETEDLVAGGKYLGTLSYVDKDRLGIWGWSFGGYTTSLVMTKGAGTYKLGIAGAPVTTWRYYDNIYTERFLQRPQDNPTGYDENSPVKFADKLQGKFLLIHGTGDDNVHFQNSVALEEALILAGKQFRSHFYPDQAHGFRGGKINHHLYTLMTEFVLENL
ncbi:MAG: S9 family peptidase [Flammeovirgaceae bacterium]|nr:S9 family peptidase [Flammeovirgaceae bacterium]